VIEHLSQGYPEYRHPYLIPRDQKRIGVIVVGTDRGLCGGLNINLFRQLLADLQTWQAEGKEVSFCVIGVKAEQFLQRLGVNIIASVQKLGDSPSVAQVVGPVGVMLNAFDNEKLDGLYLYYNQFVSTMSQKPTSERLLPIAEEYFAPKKEEKKSQARWDYIYEPDAKELLDLLLERFIETRVYHGLVENFACEQAARMMAMKSASDNAGELIDSLQLDYNKARQAAITQELAEIVGGAAAV
jgi:F-type H+-transporting ATPase subunit gamma